MTPPEAHDFPPLTSVVDYPIHPEGIYGPETWWACQHPERSRDDWTGYDWRCSPCVLMAGAHVKIQGDQVVHWTPTAGARPVIVTQSWLVERSRHWLGLSNGRDGSD